MSNIRLVLLLLLLIFSLNIFGQSSYYEVDNIINKVYNLDFENIPEEIANIGKTEPQIACYLRIDYLWWRMISNHSISTESEFCEYLNSFKENKSGIEEEFERLTYFMYQIRYDNFKNEGFSRYLTALNFHFFIGKMDNKKAVKLNSLENSILQLTIEFDKYMKYKYLNSFGFYSKRNIEQCQLCLRNIEKMTNVNSNTFATIKNYLLGKIYLEIEKDYLTAYEKFGNLSAAFPGNKIFVGIKKDCKAHISKYPN